METIIEETYETPSRSYVQARCGKTAALVTLDRDGAVRVCVQNACHKAWKTGAGRYFPNIFEALSGYKSGEAKAVIQAAFDYNNEK